MTPLSTMLCLCTTSSLPRLTPSVSCSLWGHPIGHFSVPVRQPRSLFTARWPMGLCACIARSELARVLRTLGCWLLTVYQFGCSSVLPLEPSCPTPSLRSYTTVPTPHAALPPKFPFVFSFSSICFFLLFVLFLFSLSFLIQICVSTVVVSASELRTGHAHTRVSRRGPLRSSLRPAPIMPASLLTFPHPLPPASVSLSPSHPIPDSSRLVSHVVSHV